MGVGFKRSDLGSDYLGSHAMSRTGHNPTHQCGVIVMTSGEVAYLCTKRFDHEGEHKHFGNIRRTPMITRRPGQPDLSDKSVLPPGSKVRPASLSMVAPDASHSEFYPFSPDCHWEAFGVATL